MARPLGALDILVIAGLIILAAVIIWILRPLIVVIVILAAGYLIYRWYAGRRVRDLR